MIRRTFVPILLPPWGLPQHEHGDDASLNDVSAQLALTALSTALIDRFGTAEAYEIFPDVERCLSRLRSFPSASSASLALGLASNSDRRILGAMRELKLSKWLNLYALGSADEKMSTPDDDERDPARPPPILSYDIGHEKPSAVFFQQALARINAHIRLYSHSGTEQVQLDETLFIGDHLTEDFRAARDAGMQSLWLRRGESESIQGDASYYAGPHNEAADEHFAKHGYSSEEERGRTVRDLDGVVNWLERWNR